MLRSGSSAGSAQARRYQSSVSRAGGAAVLISTHLLPLAVQACDEAVVLRGGVVVGAAPTAELTGDSGDARYRSLIT